MDKVRKAFDDTGRLLMLSPVGFDTLKWRKLYLSLPKEKRQELKDHIMMRLPKFPKIERVALEYVKQSEFTSDYYFARRGPYQPAAVHLIGGLMYFFLTKTP